MKTVRILVAISIMAFTVGCKSAPKKTVEFELPTIKAEP